MRPSRANRWRSGRIPRRRCAGTAHVGATVGGGWHHFISANRRVARRRDDARERCLDAEMPSCREGQDLINALAPGQSWGSDSNCSPDSRSECRSSELGACQLQQKAHLLEQAKQRRTHALGRAPPALGASMHQSASREIAVIFEWKLARDTSCKEAERLDCRCAAALVGSSRLIQRDVGCGNDAVAQNGHAIARIRRRCQSLGAIVRTDDRAWERCRRVPSRRQRACNDG